MFVEDIDFRCYPIWDTFFMQNENLCSRKQQFINKGLSYINDLYTNRGDLHGFESLTTHYDIKINFVDFYSLMHSIPIEWKQGYESNLENHQVKQNVYEYILKMPKVCRGTYWKLIQNIKVQRGHCQKWSKILNEEIRENEWEAIFSANFQCTIDSKMRAFQYQILLRSITTNKFLKLCKIKESDKCYFCENAVETVEHLFWFCPIVQTFWLSIAYKVHDVFDITGFLKDKIVLLGYTELCNANLVNHMFNIIKRYIYVTKCTESNLNLERVINIIKFHFKIEKNIVECRHGNINIFENKWKPLEQLLV